MRITDPLLQGPATIIATSERTMRRLSKSRDAEPDFTTSVAEARSAGDCGRVEPPSTPAYSHKRLRNGWRTRLTETQLADVAASAKDESTAKPSGHAGDKILWLADEDTNHVSKVLFPWPFLRLDGYGLNVECLKTPLPIQKNLTPKESSLPKIWALPRFAKD